MGIVFADYTPSLDRMIPALAVQLAILGVLAAALVSYNRQYAPLTKCIGVVVGGGVAAVVVIIGLGTFSDGFDQEFMVGFFELWFFAITAAFGMVVSGLGLALWSAANR